MRDPRETRADAFDPLERGLLAGFGAADASVLAVLEHRTGSSLRLALPDPGGEREPILERPRAARAGSRYEVLGELARGGLGVVLEGRDVDLGRSVAIKVLHERFQDEPEVIERFIEEAQIGGQLQHPGIVPVYELGLQADQRPFFAMKLVRGDTLAELLRKRKGPADPRLIDAFLRICQTVAYAHSRRVIHRDLKPSNVLIGRFGEVQVLDWGLAKVLRRGGVADERPARSPDASRIATVRSGEGSSASMAGSVMGTPAYMPPEQARGEIEQLDERADVFALGAMLCELLTGAPPYTAREQSEVLRAAAEARQAPALERLAAADCDPELAELARACIAPAPDSRPADADEVAARVEAHLATTAERARSAEVRAAVLRVRARSTAVVAALVLVGLVAGGTARFASLRSDWERQRDTEARAAVAMSEAEHLAGQAQRAGLGGVALYGRASSAARSAREIVSAGEAATEVSARIEARIAELEREEAALRSAAAREAAHEVWLARVREVRVGPDVVRLDWRDGERRQVRDAARRSADLTALFGELGFDARSTSPEEALAAFDCTHRLELARALDAWAEAERVLAAFSDEPEPESWRRLVRVARRLDPDHPWRNALRDELSRDELEPSALARLVRAEELGQRTPEELALVVSLLDAAGDLETAVSTQLAALRRHPEDYWLQASLPALLASDEVTSNRHAVESERAIAAAASLRPGSRVARFNLALLGSPSAVEILDELIADGPPNPVLTTWRYMLTMRRGDFTLAAESLPELLGDLRATNCLWDYYDFLVLHGHGEALLEPDAPLRARAFVLFGLERHDEALAAIEELRAGPAEGWNPWRLYELPAFRAARSVEELRALHRRLLSLATEEEEPLAAVPGPEALAAAELLGFGWRDLPAATRLYARAFAADPALEERRRFVSARVEAACVAALASADVSPGSHGLAPSERASLRALARDWLHRELDAIERELAAGRPSDERALSLSQTLNGLEVYGWIAPIREEHLVAGHPREEQVACRFLWARLDGVRRMYEHTLGT